MNETTRTPSQIYVRVPGVRRHEPSLLEKLEDVSLHPERARKISLSWAKTAVLGLPSDFSEPWLEALVRYQHGCGCTLGGAAAIAGFVATSTWQFWNLRQFTIGAFVVTTVKVLAATLLCAVLGKLTGLAFGRWRFRRATKSLLARISRA